MISPWPMIIIMTFMVIGIFACASIAHIRTWGWEDYKTFVFKTFFGLLKDKE